MSERRLFLDESPGEIRGVVVLDGQPERLLLQRHDDDHRLDLDATLVGRVANVEAAIGAAFLDVGGGLQVVLPFKPDARPVRGSSLEVQVRGEARDGKLATVRLIGEGAGSPRLMTPPPSLRARLQGFATGAAITYAKIIRLFVGCKLLGRCVSCPMFPSLRYLIRPRTEEEIDDIAFVRL